MTCEPQNLVDLWEQSAAQYRDRRFLGVRDKDGSFRWLTYGSIAQRVDDVRSGLAGLGIDRGDAVGIIANNRPEWVIAAFATYGRGARFVPMYEAELPAVWRYILDDAAVRVLFVPNARVRELLGDVSGMKRPLRIVVLDEDGPDSFAELEKSGRAAPLASVRPGPQEVAALVYTSGTTGEPKGVLLSHGNFTANVQAGHRLYHFLGPEDCTVSLLPWAHVYGQTAELYHFMSIGASSAIAESAATLAGDMLAVRPTYLITVPRVFNRTYDAVFSKVSEQGGIKQRLFAAALAAARRKRETGHGGFRHWLLDRVVFQKIRDRFGGRLKGALSGSAKMNVEIAQFFFDIGVPVYDCYGLTETSPAVTMNCPDAYKLGTVGRPVEKVTVTIEDLVDDQSGDGEIVVHGPNVMLGYHNKPEATKAVMTPDGGLRTGDRGHLDADGFLHVTGRFKEQYKLENGKYVFPSAIEEQIKLIPYVLNAMVFGDGKPFNECILVPDLARLRKHAAELGLSVDPEWLFTTDSDIGRTVRDLIGKDVANHLRGHFANYEIPARFHFVSEDFTVANGLLTQTLKVKRAAVLAHFAAELRP